MILSLSFLCLVALATGSSLGKPSNIQADAISLYTRVFSLPNYSGNYRDYYDNVYDLYDSGINDDIDSVHQTGMWVYCENNNFNQGFSGRVYFVHGIDLSMNLPNEYRDMASSLRYVGNREYLNDDTWTIFEGQYFTGADFYSNTDAQSLGNLDLAGSSLVLTGLSPWTLYSGLSWSGDAVCVYPNTDHDVGPMGDTLDFGIYTTMSALGLPDNSVRSVRKGCWADKVINSSEVKYDGKVKNGAWGHGYF